MAPQNKKELELPIPEEPSLPNLLEAGEKRNILEPFIVLAKRKAFIIFFTLAAAILSVVYAMTRPIFYQASARMMPPQQGQSFASAMMDQLGGLGPLAGLLGGGGLMKTPSDLYVAILRSRSIEDKIIDRFHLMERYNKKLRTDARSQLEGLSEIAASKDGTLIINVEDKDPEKAAEMANAYIDELGKLMSTLAISDASKRRVFYEKESKDASDQLAVAEVALKKTSETTGIIQLDAQSRVMLEAYADLRAQISAKEVELQAMRSFATAENPDLIRLQQELAGLRSQLAHYEQGNGGGPIEDQPLKKLPERGLEYVRKLREVRYREALLGLLLKQYEAARVDEGRDFAMIQTLDPAVAPERRSRPHRAVICISITLVAFLLACGWAYFKEAVEHAKEDPHYAARIQLLKFYLLRWRRTDRLGT